MKVCALIAKRRAGPHEIRQAAQVNGGSATAFNANGQNIMSVDAGVYTVAELAAAGYDTSYDLCSEIQIPNGGTDVAAFRAARGWRTYCG